jgi:hypothetical protein
MDALGSAHGRETWLVLMPCIASTWTGSATLAWGELIA